MFIGFDDDMCVRRKQQSSGKQERPYRSTLEVVIGRKKCVLNSAFAVGAIRVLATTAENGRAKTSNEFESKVQIDISAGIFMEC